MDEITRQVRDFYRRYPYPPKPEVGVRGDNFPRLMLSYLGGQPERERPIRVLDAGCGTGGNSIAIAALHPDVEVTAVDLNSVGLAEVRREAELRGLKNLLVQEVDLMTLEGLVVPAGGFDVICSSGVLHHLSNPEQGLRGLERVLAPQGVLLVMVYGRHGREPLNRFVKALELARPGGEEVAVRLPFARALAKAAGSASAVSRAPWEDTPDVSDVEFVDRYLHVNAVSYTVQEAFELLERTELRFLRWLEPRDWNIRSLMAEGPITEELEALSLRDQYQLVEQLYERPGLEFIACHRDARPRAALTREGLADALIDWNPQACLESRKWWLGGSDYHEKTSVRVRMREPILLSGVRAALAHLFVKPRPGSEMVEVIQTQLSVGAEEVFEGIWDLVGHEIFYVP